MADVSSSEGKTKSQKIVKQCNKRTRNPEEWHKHKQKRLRIAGKEHINSNGKFVAAKEPGPDCNCRRKCYQKIPEQVRQKTFEGFYSLKSYDAQNAYLFGLMRQIDIKRKRMKGSLRRTCTFEYFIRVRGRETRVCQVAFKNIHAITERKVRVLCKKMDEGVMYPSDNRGKNSGGRAGEVRLPQDTINQIKDHIFSIVHTNKLKDYMRMDKVKGLDVNITKMWKDYIATYDPQHIASISCKSKKSNQEQESASVLPNTYPQQVQGAGPSGESYHPLTYPGSGHLINLAESYFAQAVVSQSQYPGQHIGVGNYIHTDKLAYYQQGQLVVQPSVQQVTVPSIAAPIADSNTYVIFQPIAATQTNNIKEEVIKEQIGKNSKEKRKGPAVKQWRYTAIFHEEINGSTWTAIKTRMASYINVSDESCKKKIKGEKQIPQQAIIHQTLQPQTVTISTPVHIRHVTLQ